MVVSSTCPPFDYSSIGVISTPFGLPPLGNPPRYIAAQPVRRLLNDAICLLRDAICLLNDAPDRGGDAKAACHEPRAGVKLRTRTVRAPRLGYLCRSAGATRWAAISPPAVCARAAARTAARCRTASPCRDAETQPGAPALRPPSPSRNRTGRAARKRDGRSRPCRRRVRVASFGRRRRWPGACGCAVGSGLRRAQAAHRSGAPAIRRVGKSAISM